MATRDKTPVAIFLLFTKIIYLLTPVAVRGFGSSFLGIF